MNKLWLSFSKEKNGHIVDYLVLIAIIGVIAAFIFPQLRQEVSCIQKDSTTNLNQSITSSGGPKNECVPALEEDWIADGSTPAPPPSGGGGTTVPPDPSKDATVKLPTEKDAAGCLVIRTVGELQAMDNNLKACYVLGNDIDASGTATWNGGKGFSPIGLKAKKTLDGNFDGKGHSIKGLFVNRVEPDSPAALIVGSTGLLENIVLDSPSIKGQEMVAVLASYAGKTVSNITVINAVVEGSYRVAGIVSIPEGELHSIYFSGTVKGDREIASIANNVSKSASKIYSKATLTHRPTAVDSFSGGFFSMVFSSDPSKIITFNQMSCVCQFEGDRGFSGFGSVYGVGGSFSLQDISIIGTMESNNFSPVTENIGGIKFSSNASLQRVMISMGGSVPNNDPNYEPFAAPLNGVTVTKSSSFYNSTLTPKRNAAATAKTTSQLKTQSTYAGWDFTNVWAIDPAINNGYPYLRNAPPK